MGESDPEGSSESSLKCMRPAASREMFGPEEAERVALGALSRLHGCGEVRDRARHTGVAIIADTSTATSITITRSTTLSLLAQDG